MKNAIAIGIGMALIAAAVFVAARTTNQDIVQQPQVAQVLATELHTTPSATPTATVTPTATPTPIHITTPNPTTQEVLALLFQYPYEDTPIDASRARARIEVVYLDVYTDGRTRCLIVTGDRVTAGRGLQVASGAFAALLMLENDEYVVKALQVYLGHGDMLVSYSASPSGDIVFRFRSAALSDEQAILFQHTYFLHPCSVPVGTATAAAIEQAQGLTHQGCYW